MTKGKISLFAVSGEDKAWKTSLFGGRGGGCGGGQVGRAGWGREALKLLFIIKKGISDVLYLAYLQ